MKKTHCIAGCTYYIKAEKLTSILETGCFHLLENDFDIPWWKRFFKKKPAYYKVMCLRSIDITLDN